MTLMQATVAVVAVLIIVGILLVEIKPDPLDDTFDSGPEDDE